MPNNTQLDEMQTLQPEIPKRPEWMFVVQLINISDVYGGKKFRVFQAVVQHVLHFVLMAQSHLE